MSVNIRSRFDGELVPVRLSCGKGMTKQSMKDESDINFILAKYKKTGIMPQPSQERLGQFLDLPEQIDLHTALEFMDIGSEAFDALPASVRKEYNNSPVEFLSALQNNDHRERLIELGVFDKPEPPAKPADDLPAAPPAEPPADDQV